MASGAWIGWGAANHGCIGEFFRRVVRPWTVQALVTMLSLTFQGAHHCGSALDDYGGEHITYQGPLPALEVGEFHPAGRAPSWDEDFESGEFVITELARALPSVLAWCRPRAALSTGSRINGKMLGIL